MYSFVDAVVKFDFLDMVEREVLELEFQLIEGRVVLLVVFEGIVRSVVVVFTSESIGD